jgi:hypothetical protein
VRAQRRRQQWWARRQAHARGGATQPFIAEQASMGERNLHVKAHERERGGPSLAWGACGRPTHYAGGEQRRHASGDTWQYAALEAWAECGMWETAQQHRDAWVGRGSGCRGKEEPRIRCARARSRAPGRGAAR